MMKKFLLLASALALASCYMEECSPSTVKREEARRMYNDFGTKIAPQITEEQGYKLFGSCYWERDDVYVFSGLWGKKYILVHNGEPITYAEEEDLKKSD